MRIPKKQKLPKYSNWKRLHELWKSSISIGWAQYVSDLSNKNGLCLSKIEAGKKLLVYPYLFMFVNTYMKFFWLNFEFLTSCEQFCMHYSLNSAPCKICCPKYHSIHIVYKIEHCKEHSLPCHSYSAHLLNFKSIFHPVLL